MDEILKSLPIFQPGKFWLFNEICIDELGDYHKWVEEQISKPGLMDAYQRYRGFIEKMNTDEIIIGQAFGL